MPDEKNKSIDPGKSNTFGIIIERKSTTLTGVGSVDDAGPGGKRPPSIQPEESPNTQDAPSENTEGGQKP